MIHSVTAWPVQGMRPIQGHQPALIPSFPARSRVDAPNHETTDDTKGDQQIDRNGFQYF